MQLPCIRTVLLMLAALFGIIDPQAWKGRIHGNGREDMPRQSLPHAETFDMQRALVVKIKRLFTASHLTSIVLLDGWRLLEGFLAAELVTTVDRTHQIASKACSLSLTYDFLTRECRDSKGALAVMSKRVEQLKQGKKSMRCIRIPRLKTVVRIQKVALHTYSSSSAFHMTCLRFD